ncbi:MAG: winged helix-turn-helix transcriptional regulator [Lachnospiraceae bacterium]|nr:winged helix-turn-helix transcriptional regulator [Lachnospiraceae bacterium]
MSSDTNSNNTNTGGMSTSTTTDGTGITSEIASTGINSNPAKRSALGETYTWKALVLDVPRHRVTYNGEEIELTNREFLMLKTLLENMDIVLSRDTLLERVCGYEYVGETNVIDVYVRYLRTKIDEEYGVKMIQTVRGVGYVIKAE